MEKNNNEETSFEFRDLGAKVRKLRLNKGLTQKDVADKLGVTPGYLSNVENSRTAMSLRVLTYYAQLMGLTLDELVGKIQPEYRESSAYNTLVSEIRGLTTKEQEKLVEMLRIYKSKES